MMNKRLLLAGMVAAISISAAGVPAYAATTQQSQTGIEADSDQNNDKTGEKPADGQLGRKSDEEAMKEGNPTPDLPDGVTTDDFDAPMTRPDGDNTQTPPQKPDGDDTQTPPEKPSGDSTEAPSEKPRGDDTQTPPEKPADDNGNGSQDGQKETPGKKSDEDAMKEGNKAPDLPQGVSTDVSGDEA